MMRDRDWVLLISLVMNEFCPMLQRCLELIVQSQRGGHFVFRLFLTRVSFDLLHKSTYYVMCTNDVQAHHWGRFHNMTFLRFDKTPTHLHTNAAAMKFITFLWVILSFINVSGNVLKNHSWLLALDTVALQRTTTLEMMGFRRELNARGLLSRRKAMINCIGTFQSAVYDLDSPYLRDNIFALRVPNRLATTRRNWVWRTNWKQLCEITKGSC